MEDRTEVAQAWCQRYVDERRARDPLAGMLRGDPALAAVYAFVRHTLDLAYDEAPDALDAWEEALTRAWHGEPVHPIHVALLALGRATGLPFPLLHDVIEGARVRRSAPPMPTGAHVRRHAARVAGPLAGLLLHATGGATATTLRLGERFATGLQLVDDLVDLGVDAAAARVRIADDELAAFGVDPIALSVAPLDEPTRDLVRLLASRARTEVCYGAALRRMAPIALRPFVATSSRLAMRTLERIERDPDLVIAGVPARRAVG